jgi:Xaa-Pro aminopeptidase
MPTETPKREFADRLATVRARLGEAGADAAVWFGATAIEYLTGFHHIQTERPVCLAVTADRVELTVPRLEVERVSPNPGSTPSTATLITPAASPSRPPWRCSRNSESKPSGRTPTAPRV